MEIIYISLIYYIKDQDFLIKLSINVISKLINQLVVNRDLNRGHCIFNYNIRNNIITAFFKICI